MGVADHGGAAGQTVSITAATYGNGMYVAAGTCSSGDPAGGETPVVITSHDGVKWTMSALNNTCSLKQIAFGNGTFAAAGSDGGILTSPDGVTWTERDTGARGRYVADTSFIGDSFTAWDPGVKTRYGTVCFCGSRFVALGAVRSRPRRTA